MRPVEPNPDQPGPPDYVLVCSYVPLLAGLPRRLLGTDEPEFLRVLVEAERCPSGQADALLWVADADGLQPVFLMEQADAIADHLLGWSDGRPEAWFPLCIAERGDRFVAALVPNLTRSVERFTALHPTTAPGPAGPVGYDLLFRPLFFVSKPKHTFGQVRHLVASPTRVGLLDAETFTDSRPPSLALNRVRTVGPVEVCWDERPFGFDVRPLLEQLLAPDDGPNLLERQE